MKSPRITCPECHNLIPVKVDGVSLGSHYRGANRHDEGRCPGGRLVPLTLPVQDMELEVATHWPNSPRLIRFTLRDPYRGAATVWMTVDEMEKFVDMARLIRGQAAALQERL